MQNHPSNAYKIRNQLAIFKALAALFFLLACGLAAFIGLSDVSPKTLAPALYSAIEESILSTQPWYVWVYVVSFIGAFITIFHEIYVDGEMLLGESIWCVFLVVIPALNTLRIALYLSNFVSGESVVWRRRRRHHEDDYTQMNQGW